MAHKKKSDLERAFAALQAKNKPYSDLFDYYDGKHKLKYNSQRFKNIFKELDVDFSENWSAVVIDATYNRVNIAAIKIAGEEKEKQAGVMAALKRVKERLLGKSTTEQEKLDAILERNEVILDSADVHSVAGITGESYYFVWMDEKDQVVGFYNDPRKVHIFYDEENSRQKKYAAKWWVDEDDFRRLNLYYPDRLEYYSSTSAWKNVSAASAFVPVDQDGDLVTGEGENIEENPFGKIPIFHFRPVRRMVKSDLTNVIPLQDAVNKLASDMMIVSEFGALAQRFIIGNVEIDGSLKNAPNEIWSIPAGDGEGQDTEVGELTSSEPAIYLKPITHNINAISSITSTPAHFFFEGGKSSISGEALIALEAPLNDKATDRIDSFGPVWQQVISFMLEISETKVEPQNIMVIYEPPQTIQPLTISKIREIDRRAGIPLITTLRRSGWSEAEIDQLIIDQDEERQRNQASLGSALLTAKRDFDNPEAEENDDDDEE